MRCVCLYGCLMRVRQVIVSQKSQLWYANVHEPHTPLSLAYLRGEDGKWRNFNGEPPDEAMERLMIHAVEVAESQGKSELQARWTPTGIETF